MGVATKNGPHFSFYFNIFLKIFVMKYAGFRPVPGEQKKNRFLSTEAAIMDIIIIIIAIKRKREIGTDFSILAPTTPRTLTGRAAENQEWPKQRKIGG